MGGEVLQLIFDNGKVRIARTQGVQKMAQWHARFFTPLFGYLVSLRSVEYSCLGISDSVEDSPR